MYWVSNSFKMVSDMIDTYHTGLPGNPRLTDVPEFTALLNSSLSSANLVTWVNPRSLAVIRRQFAKKAAEEQVFSHIDWKVERARLEERFPAALRRARVLSLHVLRSFGLRLRPGALLGLRPR